MKHLLVTLMILMSASQAFSRTGNEGPGAFPAPPVDPVVATYSIGGGLAPRSAPLRRELTVSSRGVVRALTHYRDAEKNTNVQIAKLSSETMKKLLENIENTSAGELVNPSTHPGCMDAPSVLLRATKSSGEVVTLAKRVACIDYVKENENDADVTVAKVLRALVEIAQLQ